MLDFKELAQDGIDFELLVREILFTKGLDVIWSGVGADGGRDLVCIERIESVFGPSTRKWLVQCKHFAHSGRSVGMSDLDDIVDSSHHHDADCYALACSTHVSSKVVERLERISANRANRLETSYLDASLIERALNGARVHHIAQRYFPVSSGIEGWKVNYTDRPNHFVVSMKGYLFHLMNRIGSKYDHHLPTIGNRIEDFEKISFPKGHFIRPRAFWYDDKNGGYMVYLDYMRPFRERKAYNAASIARALGHDEVLEDGQPYRIDVVPRTYMPTSDHYDRDHYDYYVPFIGSFLVGEGRSRDAMPSDEMDWAFEYEDQTVRSEDGVVDVGADRAFDRFVSAVKAKVGDALMSASNSQPEALHLVDKGSLRAVRDTYGHNLERFDRASFRFRGSQRKKVFELIEMLDQGIDCMISCREGLTFVPGDNDRAVRDFDKPSDRILFVDFTVPFEETASGIRDKFSRYFVAMADRIYATIPNVDG